MMTFGLGTGLSCPERGTQTGCQDLPISSSWCGQATKEIEGQELTIWQTPCKGLGLDLPTHWVLLRAHCVLYLFMASPIQPQRYKAAWGVGLDPSLCRPMSEPILLASVLYCQMEFHPN